MRCAGARIRDRSTDSSDASCFPTGCFYVKFQPCRTPMHGPAGRIGVALSDIGPLHDTRVECRITPSANPTCAAKPNTDAGAGGWVTARGHRAEQTLR